MFDNKEELYLVAICLIFLFAWFVQLCWNNVMPYLFGFKTLGYWQSLSLFALVKLLFTNPGKLTK